jgi:RNA polymerase sigma-70 factor (ECF subfamily)
MTVDEQIWNLLQNPKMQRVGFEKLVKQYSETLYYKIRRIVLTHEDTNDVLQNTFIKAWNNLEQFQGKSSLSTWLYRIAINESLDFLRRQKNHYSSSTDDDSGLANQLMADEYFNGDETQAELQEAIAKLPDVQRMVFNLRYFEEMKYSDMSKMLDTSEGALKASYHQAVKKISDYFHNHD